MTEVDYLNRYYDFDDDVLDAVERAAYRQKDETWPEYKARYGIPEPIIFEPMDSKPIEVLDIAPSDFDGTIVYHQPMACALDSNIQLHVATLAAALPDKRVIGIGNPGKPGHGFGKLSARDALRVWQGDLRPAISGTLEYLNYQRLEAGIHTGESYGADKAAAAAENAYHYDHEAVRTIMVEPVSVMKSSLIRMGLTFQSTSKHAEKYLLPLRAQSQTFISAEQLKESAVGYAIGLARLSNLAVGSALGRKGFEQRVSNGLEQNPGMKVGIGWGTASEFDKDNEREVIISRLKEKFGEERIDALPLEGQTHAMNLDIYLNAAIITQLLKNTGVTVPS